MGRPLGGIHKYKDDTVLGWFGDEEKKWYREKASQIKNGSILEIGVYQGASILSIEDICKQNNTVIYGIDAWELNAVEDKEAFKTKENLVKSRETIEKIIDKYNLWHIKLIKARSEEIADTATFKFDLIFIDGDHDYKSVLQDMELYWSKVESGGIMAGHDFVFPDVERAVKTFLNGHNDYKPIKIINKVIWELEKL